MANPLQPGDRVIYKNPCMETRLKGTATLIKMLGQEPDGYQRWQIQFDDDEPDCPIDRSIRLVNLMLNPVALAPAEPHAPDLLDACQALLVYVDDAGCEHLSPGNFEGIRKAVAKATAKQNETPSLIEQKGGES